MGAVNLNAQSDPDPPSDPNCGFDAKFQEAMEDPDYYNSYQKYLEVGNSRILEDGEFGPDNLGEIIIPTVVHIFHHPDVPMGVNENITDRHIVETLRLFNEELGIETNLSYPTFTGLFGPSDTPPPTSPADDVDVADVDPGFRLVLANQDINGNFTTGIVRHPTIDPSLLFDQVIANLNTNVTSLFPATEYLNIIVLRRKCEFSDPGDYCACEEAARGLAGFFSGGDGDVLYCRYDAFNTAVLGHEIGHFFGLQHTETGGCFNNDCLVDGDFICDTPPNTALTSCGQIRNSCTTDADGTSPANPYTEDIQDFSPDNYMGDSNSCGFMYTEQQRIRMRCAFFPPGTDPNDIEAHGQRFSMIDNNLAATPNNQVTLMNWDYANGTLFTPDARPLLLVREYGNPTIDMNNLQVEISIDNNLMGTYNLGMPFDLAVPNYTYQLPALSELVTGTGAHKLSVELLPNLPNVANIQELDFYLTDNVVEVSTNCIFENFHNGEVQTSGNNNVIINGLQDWVLNPQLVDGENPVLLENVDFPFTHCDDSVLHFEESAQLFSPTLDLSNTTNPKLIFDYAHGSKFDNNGAHNLFELNIFASVDGGASYERIFLGNSSASNDRRWEISLHTVVELIHGCPVLSTDGGSNEPPIISDMESWIPDEDTDWETYSEEFAAYYANRNDPIWLGNLSEVLLRFDITFQSACDLDFYLDNIRIIDEEPIDCNNSLTLEQNACLLNIIDNSGCNRYEWKKGGVLLDISPYQEYISIVDYGPGVYEVSLEGCTTSTTLEVNCDMIETCLAGEAGEAGEDGFSLVSTGECNGPFILTVEGANCELPNNLAVEWLVLENEQATVLLNPNNDNPLELTVPNSGVYSAEVIIGGCEFGPFSVNTSSLPPNCDDMDCTTADNYNTATCECDHIEIVGLEPIEASFTPPACVNEATDNYTVSFEITGGAPTYSVTIDGGQVQTDSFFATNNTEYTIIISDDNGCSITLTETFNLSACISCPTSSLPDVTLDICHDTALDLATDAEPNILAGITDDDATATDVDTDGNADISWFTDETLTTPYDGSNIVHSGLDICAPETVTLYAAIECSIDATVNSIAAGTFTLMVYPDMSTWAVTIMDDGACGPYVDSYDCEDTEGFDITNDYDGNGNTPDFSLENSAGTVSFIVSNSAAPANCQDSPIASAGYNCANCPTVTSTAMGSTDYCGDDSGVNLSAIEEMIVYDAAISPVAISGIEYYLTPPAMAGNPPMDVYTVGEISNIIGGISASCDPITTTVYAYVVCDLLGDGSVINYLDAGSFEVVVYPDLSALNIVVMDDGACGPYVDSYDCEGNGTYSIANDYDGNITNPDFSTETMSGDVIFTVTNSAALTTGGACNEVTATAEYVCAPDCPSESSISADAVEYCGDVTITITGVFAVEPSPGTFDIVSVDGLVATSPGVFDLPTNETCDIIQYNFTATATCDGDGSTIDPLDPLDMTIEVTVYPETFTTVIVEGSCDVLVGTYIAPSIQIVASNGTAECNFLEGDAPICNGTPSTFIGEIKFFEETNCEQTFNYSEEVNCDVPDCDDNDCNTEDSFNTTTCECIYTDIEEPSCDDDDCLTEDSYDEDNCECINTPFEEPDCNDNDCNTDDSYDSFNCQCNNILNPPNCNDEDCLTVDTYDSNTCECSHVTIADPYLVVTQSDDGIYYEISVEGILPSIDAIYYWSTTGGTIPASSTNQSSITVSEAGGYQVLLTLEGDCSIPLSTTIYAPPTIEKECETELVVTLNAFSNSGLPINDYDWYVNGDLILVDSNGSLANGPAIFLNYESQSVSVTINYANGTSLSSTLIYLTDDDLKSFELFCCLNTLENSDEVNLKEGDGPLHIWETTHLQDALLNAGFTNTPFSSNGDLVYRINNDIIIESGGTLYLDNVQIEFGPHARIIVNKDGELITSNNTTLKGSCNSVWQGIQIEGPGNGVDSEETVNYANFGAVDINAGTTIQDAIIGVTTFKMPLINVIGNANSLVEILSDYDTADFSPAINNQQTLSSLFLSDYVNTTYANQSSGGHLQINNSSFIDCFQGINLSWYDNMDDASTIPPVSIQYCDFENEQGVTFPFTSIPEVGIEMNSFRDNASENNVTIAHNTFNNLRYGIRAYDITQIDFDYNTFNYCYTAASVMNVDNMGNANRSVEFNENDFFNSKICAIQCASTDVGIYKNIIDNNPDNNPDQYTSLGIVLRACFYDVGNPLLNPDPTINKGNQIRNSIVGIRLISNEANSSNIDGNILEGHAASVWASGNNTGTEMFRNCFSDYKVAALFVNDFVVNSIPEESAVFDDLGNCGLNIFDNPANNHFAPLSSAFFDIYTSTFFTYHCLVGPNLVPLDVNINCDVNSECVGIPPADLCDPNGFDDGGLEEETIDVISGMTDGEIAQIADIKIRNRTALQKWNYYQSQGADLTTSENMMNGVNTKLSKRLLVSHYLTKGNITQSNESLNAITDETAEDADFRAVRTIEQTLMTGDNMTDEQENIMRDIATGHTQSPFTAQSYLFLRNREEFPFHIGDWPDEIATYANGNIDVLFKGFSELNEQIKLYPNPTDKQLNIWLDISERTQAAISIYNSKGNVVYQGQINHQTTTLETSNWPIGLYYYEITDNNQLIQKDKLLIVR